MADPENEEQKEPVKSGGIKQIVIIASTVVATVLAIASAFYFTQIMKAPKNAPDKPVVDAKKKATYFKLKEFTVNLSSEGEYLEAEMTLELSDEEVKKEINDKMPRVRDEVLSILMSKTGSSLRSAPGKETLKNEIKTKLNTILTTGKVSTIHFTSFLMQ